MKIQHVFGWLLVDRHSLMLVVISNTTASFVGILSGYLTE